MGELAAQRRTIPVEPLGRLIAHKGSGQDIARHRPAALPGVVFALVTPAPLEYFALGAIRGHVGRTVWCVAIALTDCRGAIDDFGGGLFSHGLNSSLQESRSTVLQVGNLAHDKLYPKPLRRGRRTDRLLSDMR